MKQPSERRSFKVWRAERKSYLLPVTASTMEGAIEYTREFFDLGKDVVLFATIDERPDRDRSSLPLSNENQTYLMEALVFLLDGDRSLTIHDLVMSIGTDGMEQLAEIAMKLKAVDPVKEAEDA